MHQNNALCIIGFCILIATTFLAGGLAKSAPKAPESITRVFEIRTYTTEPTRYPI